MIHATRLRQRALAALGAVCLALMAGPLAARDFKWSPLLIGDIHLMLIDLKRPLSEGDRFRLTLRFQSAGERDVTVWVQKPRGPASPHAATEHKH